MVVGNQVLIFYSPEAGVEKRVRFLPWEVSRFSGKSRSLEPNGEVVAEHEALVAWSGITTLWRYQQLNTAHHGCTLLPSKHVSFAGHVFLPVRSNSWASHAFMWLRLKPNILLIFNQRPFGGR